MKSIGKSPVRPQPFTQQLTSKRQVEKAQTHFPLMFTEPGRPVDATFTQHTTVVLYGEALGIAPWATPRAKKGNTEDLRFNIALKW